jgi:hypothetical protein
MLGGKAVRGGNYPIGTIDFRDISPSVCSMEVNARYLNVLGAKPGLITVRMGNRTYEGCMD